ncbi:hypothetical protein ACWDRX_21285, partial [Streptomyces nigra]
MTVRRRLLGWLADAALILYFVFALFPIAWMVILSLKPANQLFSTYFSFSPTLDGYRTVLWGGRTTEGRRSRGLLPDAGS